MRKVRVCSNNREHVEWVLERATRLSSGQHIGRLLSRQARGQQREPGHELIPVALEVPGSDGEGNGENSTRNEEDAGLTQEGGILVQLASGNT